MQNNIKEKIISDITDFEEKKSIYTPIEAENALIIILKPLLNFQGYEILHNDQRRDYNGVDFVGIRGNEKLGIEFKHYKSLVGSKEVRSLIGSAIISSFDKVILLSSSSFTKNAFEIAEQIDPIAIELMDIKSLKNWVSKVEANYDESEVIKIITTASKKIIELISKNPRTLDEIEWRDLERVMAEIFDGIGFQTKLPPSSKDGGKDIILECQSINNKSFIVEIKHWRSKQKVGEKMVKDFLKIITKEKRNAGLFLSTYGYTENAIESITEIERQKIRFGQEDKIISLCKTYIKKKSGIWEDNNELSEILFFETI